MSLPEAFRLLIPDFALLLLGFALMRFTPLGRPVWEGVERLTYYVLFPVLLFDTCSRSHVSFGASLPFFAAGFGSLLLGVLFAFALAELPFNRRLWASGAQTAFRFNTYVALTVADRLFGQAGVSWMAMLVAVAVPVCNFAAVTALSRHGSRRMWLEILKNPLIIATVSGLVANALEWHIPVPLTPAVTRMGSAAIALGLMSVGAGLSFRGLAHSPGLTLCLMGLRHAVIPAVALGVAALLPMPAVPATIAILFASLPTASSAYILTQRMGGAGDYVASLVTLSTLLSALSIPVFLSLARLVT